ncbi:thioredoxin [Litorimonas sp. WD9-15]|uniref:thioredoxin n=1 Tax=Litorimonas sp. WD9-15 TaxID=3418716 RepID=UPI003D092A80
MTELATDIVKDGTDMSFMTDVIEASADVPVIVDFWAPWCGPCKQLMPVLERTVKAAGGKVKLVKINTQEQNAVATQLGVRSIPAVYAFKNGQPVDGFMGAQPETAVKEFVAKLSGETDPVEDAKKLVARGKDSLAAGDPGGAAQDFAGALSLDPNNPSARAGLARLYMESGNEDGAFQLIHEAPESVLDHPEISALKAQFDLRSSAPEEDDATAELAAKVADNPDDLDARLELAKALVGAGRNAEAVDHLIYSIGKNRMHDDEAARLFLLTIFEAEGTESDVSRDGRRRLSSILYA